MAAQAELDEIKARLPIEDVIGSHVSLRRAGGSLVGLCPFHNEKTPSFRVYPEEGRYKCFGCQEHGDIFSFVMKTEHVAFPEALERLADKAGVELAKRGTTGDAQQRERLREVLNRTASHWHDLLLRDERAAPIRAYLKERGIDWTSVETFNLGWAPDSFDETYRWLLDRGVTEAELIQLGLVVARDAERGGGIFDRFRHRLIFPIHDGRGRLTGFGGRAMAADAKPKYLNSTDSPLFNKSETLYAIDQAHGAIRDAGQVVVVEGYVDALIAHQFGIKNVVASLGTALTERQVQLLKRLTNRVVLALDADAAGSEATVRGLGVIEQVYRSSVAQGTARGRIRQQAIVNADIRILALPDGDDPDEVIRRDPAEWHRLVENALPFVDFYLQHYTRDLDPEDASQQAAIAATILQKIALLADRVMQAHYVARLAARIRINEAWLFQELAQYRQRPDAPPPAEPPPGRSDDRPSAASGPANQAAPTRATAPARPAGRRQLGDRVLRLLVIHPESAGLWQELAPEWFESTLARELVSAVQAAQAAAAGSRLEEIREGLPPILSDYWEELAAEGAQDPRLTEHQLATEAGDAFTRLRKEAIARRRSLLQRDLADLPIDLGEPAVSALMASHAQAIAELNRLYLAHANVQDPDYSAVGRERHLS